MERELTGQGTPLEHNFTTPASYPTAYSEHHLDWLLRQQHPCDRAKPFAYRDHQSSPTFAKPPVVPKRVRRKQSVEDLVGLPPTVLTPRLPPASSRPPRYTVVPNSSVKLVATPRRPTTVTPSLSSSITTAPSTSTSECFSPVAWQPLEWTWPVTTSQEPIRTKRRFTSLKQAKRLPHREGGLWEVHATVTDLGRADFRGHSSADSTEYESSKDLDTWSQVSETPSDQPSEHTSRPKQRTVRFEGLSSTFASSRNSKSLEKDLTSSFSLSRFQFPEPPSCGWQGTFGSVPMTCSHRNNPTANTFPPGHLTDGDSPSGIPATLHYRGASFDLVNPHDSLLLGSHDLETPAEIDGLLDSYFETRNPDDMPDQLSTQSQQSLSTPSESSKRTRLYHDADSARRNIMRLPGQTVSNDQLGRSNTTSPEERLPRARTAPHTASSTHDPVLAPLNVSKRETIRRSIVDTFGHLFGSRNDNPVQAQTDDDVEMQRIENETIYSFDDADPAPGMLQRRLPDHTCANTSNKRTAAHTYPASTRTTSATPSRPPRDSKFATTNSTRAHTSPPIAAPPPSLMIASINQKEKFVHVPAIRMIMRMLLMPPEHH